MDTTERWYTGYTTAETYITRINRDWKTNYLGTDIIEIPLCKLDKLTLDNWAHRLIQDYGMTKNQYFNVTVIMRQALVYAVDRGIIPDSLFAGVKVDGKRLFRKVKKKLALWRWTDERKHCLRRCYG